MKKLKRRVKFYVTCCFLSLSTQIYAADSATFTATISSVGSYTAGRIFVASSPNGSTSSYNPNGCPSVTFGLDKGSANFKEMYSALLTAATYNGTAQFRISGSTCINGSYPAIIYIGLVP